MKAFLFQVGEIIVQETTDFLATPKENRYEVQSGGPRGERESGSVLCLPTGACAGVPPRGPGLAGY